MREFTILEYLGEKIPLFNFFLGKADADVP